MNGHVPGHVSFVGIAAGQMYHKVTSNPMDHNERDSKTVTNLTIEKNWL